MAKKELPLSRVYQLLEPGPVVMVSSAFKGKANVMTMSWHMMVDFEPPIVACVISDQNYTFSLIKKSKECVINIPTVESIKKVVEVGNCSGSKVDKFKKFDIITETASEVQAPLLIECYANLECKVIDTRMTKKYNIFIFEVKKAWIQTGKKHPQTIHHSGKGVFIVDGKTISLPSKKK